MTKDKTLQIAILYFLSAEYIIKSDGFYRDHEKQEARDYVRGFLPFLQSEEVRQEYDRLRVLNSSDSYRERETPCDVMNPCAVCNDAGCAVCKESAYRVPTEKTEDAPAWVY